MGVPRSLRPSMRGSLCFIAPDVESRRLFADLLTEAKQDRGPLNRVVYLTTQVTEADDETLAEAQKSDNATVKSFAEALVATMKADGESKSP